MVAPTGITSTAWPSVRDKCRDLGIGFDAWQHGAGQLILSKRADGKYATTVGGVVISIPRQVGKTFLLGAIVFALCLIHPRLTVIWTAHRLRTAGETFASMQEMTRRKKIAPFVSKVVLGSGEEEVRFTNGSRILFGARERGFGRGFAEVDVIVFDEAQILTEAALDDMIPATNQAPNPLILYTGTPPKPTDPGEVFTMKRLDALSGESDDTLYIEFSADRDAKPDDHKQWALANPSYPKRTPVEAMLRMRKNLTPDSFVREALGVWDERDTVPRVIPEDVWAALGADEGTAPAQDTPPDALAVDMSHERVLSIDGCWRDGDRVHVEILALDVAADTSSAVDWIVERAGRRMPVVIDHFSPAASMIPALKARKVNVMVVASGPDMAKACGLMFDAVMDGRLSHADQQQLNDAAAGVQKRKIGDAGGFGWDRKDPTVNLAPFVAATLAVFGAMTIKSSSGGAAFAF